MTKIEWAGETWNPWWGCTKIALECANCYAAVFASRGFYHRGVAAKGEWTGKLSPASLGHWAAPHGWRKPAFVFTCSMSDFWHEGVPLEWLDEALGVIEATPHLTYLILTKRPGMIARRLADVDRRWPANAWCGATIGHPDSLPLLKPLRAIDAPIRFLSVEPLLAPMVPGLTLDGIGWVIAGGESVGGRPCHLDWVRAVRDLTVERDVAFFFKQWGHWRNNPIGKEHDLDPKAKGGATLDGRLWRQFPA